tara:strand:+ start:3398 stop:4348 length:951 start_codon:yes stop_codon:yes gene_type:complete
MADSFKWIANKQSLVGGPLEDQFPNLQGLNTNTLGFGFNGWPKTLTTLDVTNYEVVNVYNLNDLLPFYWNWYGFTGSARSQIPLQTNSANKADVDLNLNGTFTSDLISNNDPKDRVNAQGFSRAVGNLSDSFNLRDLEGGIPNPDHDPYDSSSQFWLREPFSRVSCSARAQLKFGGINNIFKCFSGGNFIGYSFNDIGFAYAGTMLLTNQRQVVRVKLVGYYGLIENIGDLLFSYDNSIGSDILGGSNPILVPTTSSFAINNGNTSINVTKLGVDVDFVSSGLLNTTVQNESYYEGISDETAADASLGSFTFHTYS